MKRLMLVLYVLFLAMPSFAARQANQVLSIDLPEVLEIEKIIVEDIEYLKDSPMPNMKIKKTTPIDDSNTTLELSPVKVQIRTNISNPVIVSVLFKELNHKEGLYNFSQGNLSIFPKMQTISNCKNHTITEIFTPYVNVKPDSVLGLYRGTLVFTVNSL